MLNHNQPLYSMRLPVILLPGLLLLSACSTITPTQTPEVVIITPAGIGEAVPTDFQPIQLTPTPATINVYLDPALPEVLRIQASGISDLGGRSVNWTADRTEAELSIGLDPERPLASWVYAVTVPFPSPIDAITLAGLKQLWYADCSLQTEEPASTPEPGQAQVTAAPRCPGETLVVTEDVAHLLESLWGPAGTMLEVCDGECVLLDQAWQQGGRYSVMPYEALEPRWKVLRLEGKSPLDYSFEPGTYPLDIAFGLSGNAAYDEEIRSRLSWPAANYDPSKRSVIVLTGVTALTRAIAWRMEDEGSAYPADKIGSWLLEADYTHVSNEVSFTDDCGFPNPEQRELRFCSRPSYFDLLLAVDVDLVELTGNHILDYGDEPFLYSMDLYDEAGMQTFGGGRSLEEGRQPVLLSHNGNQIAFFGCNKAGPVSTWATEEEPGSNPCDEETYHILEQLDTSGYVTFFTYQWYEAYSSTPDSSQVSGFQRAVDAGADIVSGSQAHQPQGFEFYNGAFIHYGPGNLFFDQMWSQNTREEFVMVYTIHNGKHISTELKTAILEDFSQPRPMTTLERQEFLEKMFAASRWQHFLD